MNVDQKSAVSPVQENSGTKGKKLLDQASEVLYTAGFEDAAARRYVAWMREFILFHGKRHPSEMGVPEIRHFLEDGRFSGKGASDRVEATAWRGSCGADACKRGGRHASIDERLDVRFWLADQGVLPITG